MVSQETKLENQRFHSIYQYIKSQAVLLQEIISAQIIALVFDCNFERFNSKDCQVKFSGKDWVRYNTAKEQFYEIVLESEERSEIFFSNMVKPPKNGVACLSFRYRKYLDSKCINSLPCDSAKRSLKERQTFQVMFVFLSSH